MTSGQARLLLLAVTLGAGCQAEPRACPTIGCEDQVAVRIHTADFATPPATIELQIAGASLVCPPLDLSRSNFAVCAPGVTVTRQEETSCQERRDDGGISISCSGTGRFHLVLTILATPARFTATVKSGETVLAQRTFDPAYARVQPNGEGCGPVCRQASETWALP